MIIIVFYGYNQQGASNIIVSISTGPTEEPWMKDLKSMLDGNTYRSVPFT